MKISAKIFLLFSFLCLGWQTFAATAHADMIFTPSLEEIQCPANQKRLVCNGNNYDCVGNALLNNYYIKDLTIDNWVLCEYTSLTEFAEFDSETMFFCPAPTDSVEESFKLMAQNPELSEEEAMAQATEMENDFYTQNPTFTCSSNQQKRTLDISPFMDVETTSDGRQFYYFVPGFGQELGKFVNADGQKVGVYAGQKLTDMNCSTDETFAFCVNNPSDPLDKSFCTEKSAYPLYGGVSVMYYSPDFVIHPDFLYAWAYCVPNSKLRPGDLVDSTTLLPLVNIAPVSPSEKWSLEPVGQATASDVLTSEPTSSAKPNPPRIQPGAPPEELPIKRNPFQSIDPKLLLVFALIVGISLVAALILIFIRFKSPPKSPPTPPSDNLPPVTNQPPADHPNQSQTPPPYLSSNPSPPKSQ